MSEDHLITCLEALCGRFATKPVDGRFEVSKSTGLSEQYLYQILTGKRMQNGNKRSVGKDARAKITAKYPDWLSPAIPSKHQSTDIKAQEPTAHHYRPLVQKVCDLAEQIDDEGLLKLHGYAACLMAEHPHQSKAQVFCMTEWRQRIKQSSLFNDN